MLFSQKLVNRYNELKQEAGDCILLMQVGAFMKVMNEDARTVSGITGLKLMIAGEIDAPVISGGFPKSGLDAYVGKMVRAGHAVAIAFQNEQKERQIAEIINPSPAPPRSGEGRDSAFLPLPSQGRGPGG